MFAIANVARPAAVYVTTSSRPSGDVVTDGVRDQVRDEALDQLRVAGGSGRLQRRGAPQPVMIVASQYIGGRRGEVDGLPPQTSAFATGKRKQRLEQPLLAPAGGDDALAHLSQGDRVCVRVGERGLRERELDGDLTAQFVSGVDEERCCVSTASMVGATFMPQAHQSQPERIAAPSERLLRA